jgi:hypothetical protein
MFNRLEKTVIKRLATNKSINDRFHQLYALPRFIMTTTESFGVVRRPYLSWDRILLFSSVEIGKHEQTQQQRQKFNSADVE